MEKYVCKKQIVEGKIYTLILFLNWQD
jgi:hypothetical protein